MVPHKVVKNHVLIHSGFYNKISRADWVTYKHQKHFLQSGGWAPTDWACDKGCFLVHRCYLSLCPHMTEGKKELWVLFYKGTKSINEDSALISNHYPRALPPNTMTSAIGFKVRILQGYNYLFYSKAQSLSAESYFMEKIIYSYELLIKKICNARQKVGLKFSIFREFPFSLPHTHAQPTLECLWA